MFGFVALLIIGYLMMYRIDAQNIALNENDLEDTEWLTTKKLRKLREFEVSTFKDLKYSKDGIVIGAEKKGSNVEVIATSQLHALIVGTTGSGKTTGFVDQNIEVLGRCKTKPSIVITDPKKELYEKHGCIAAEMESLALFHIANVLNKKAACLMSIVDSKYIKIKLGIYGEMKCLVILTY